MKVYNIKWDVDCPEDLENLPTEIEIPHDIDTEDEDAISDYITDYTGFCHCGFELSEDVGGIYLCDIDQTFNYPDKVIIIIRNKEELDELEAELNGTAESICEFKTFGCQNNVPSNVIESAKEITEKVKLLKNSIIKGRVCSRCRSLLLPSFVDGYVYQCPQHNEDLYTIETEAIEKISPKKFQKFIEVFFNNADLNTEETFRELKN